MILFKKVNQKLPITIKIKPKKNIFLAKVLKKIWIFNSKGWKMCLNLGFSCSLSALNRLSVPKSSPTLKVLRKVFKLFKIFVKLILVILWKKIFKKDRVK